MYPPPPRIHTARPYTLNLRCPVVDNNGAAHLEEAPEPLPGYVHTARLVELERSAPPAVPEATEEGANAHVGGCMTIGQFITRP